MSKRRFTPWIVLACIGTLAACTSGEGGTVGNTEMNVVVPPPSGVDIQTVEYTINCLGNNQTFLDNNASFPDPVTLNGNLEVRDGRTSFGAGKACNGGDNNGQTCAAGAPGQAFCLPGGGTCDLVADEGPNLRNQSEVWQGFMDLPPGACTVELRAREADGEVICTAREPFSITADVVTKVNVLMICDVSFQAPVGSLDVDGSFQFNVSNFCPDLFVLNCLDTNLGPVPPDPGPEVEGQTSCEVRFRDGDNTCGTRCDPQTCSISDAGLVCAPTCSGDNSCPTEPTTVIECGGADMDCNSDGTFGDTQCTVVGNQLGLPPLAGAPQVPNPAAFGVSCTNTNPGSDITCTAVTTDGDEDCDKTKIVVVSCPGLTPCQEYADLGFFCDDGNQCTDDFCDDAQAVGGSCGDANNGSCCDADNVPDGNFCDTEAPPASCLGGVCTSTTCNTGTDPDENCNDFNDCTVPQTCDVTSGSSTEGQCLPEPPDNEPLGFTCDTGEGSGDGDCNGTGVCNSNDECLVDTDCNDDDGNECTIPQCNTTPTPWVCIEDADAANGNPCNDGAGTCTNGDCVTSGDTDFAAVVDLSSGVCVGSTPETAGDPCVANDTDGCALSVFGPSQCPACPPIGTAGTCRGGANVGDACETTDPDCAFDDVDACPACAPDQTVGTCVGGTNDGGACNPTATGCDANNTCPECPGGTPTAPPVFCEAGATCTTNTPAICQNDQLGCFVYSPTLSSFLPISVSLELLATLDSSNAYTVDYTVIAQNNALDFVADAAVFGDLQVRTEITGATPTEVFSTPDPDAIGLQLGNFLGIFGTGVLTLSSVDLGSNTIALLQESGTLTPSASTVAFNWGGLFQLDLIIISTRRCSPAGSTEPDPNGTQCASGLDSECTGTDICVGGGIIVNQDDCTFTTTGDPILFDIP